MPSVQAPQQQAPMEATGATDIVSQQPTAEPQPEMTLRGGEEAGCSLCCGLCSCEEMCC